MDRRRFIISASATSVVLLAGCADPTGDGNDDVGGGDDAEPDTGGDDGSPDNETGNESATDGDEDGQTPHLEEVLNWESSFVMEYDFENGSGQGVFHEGDYHWTWSEDGETVETYRIDGEHYVVIEGNCFQQSGETPDEDLTRPDQIENEYGEIEATGRTTVDGEDVYEFDVDGWTYYISVETGYPVQIVDEDGGTVSFSSGGDTAPISAPDMECGEAPGGNQSSGSDSG